MCGVYVLLFYIIFTSILCVSDKGQSFWIQSADNDFCKWVIFEK